MRILADENADVEWIRALADDGHDVVRVAETTELESGSPDPAVLTVATDDGRVLLTADQSDFADPPNDEHAGIVIVADVTRTGGEVRRGVRRIERSIPPSVGPGHVPERLALNPVHPRSEACSDDQKLLPVCSQSS